MMWFLHLYAHQNVPNHLETGVKAKLVYSIFHCLEQGLSETPNTLLCTTFVEFEYCDAASLKNTLSGHVTGHQTIHFTPCNGISQV